MNDKINNGSDDMNIDELKEIANIGAGNAATALSHMIGECVQMSVPKSFIGSAEQVERELGFLDKKVVACFLKIYGDIDGAMVMILPGETTVHFVKILTRKTIPDILSLTEEDKSAIQEIGNILLGASITAVNKLLNVSIMHTIPDIAVDTIGALMDQILLEMGNKEGNILVFKVNLKAEKEQVDSDLYYLFDPSSSTRLIDMLKAKLSQ